jgi:N-acetylneuraminic acid mutarotase
MARGGYIAGVVNDCYIVAGGSYWQDEQKHWTSRVDEFNPRSNVWNEGPPLPEPRSDAACVTVRDTLYAFGGGNDNRARADALALVAGQWKAIPEGTLPEPRLCASAVLSGGSVYVVAGMSDPADYTSLKNTLWRWTPGAGENSWEVLPSFPGPGLINAAVATVGQKIYVLGGAQAGGQNVVNSSKAYVFDCGSERWQKLPDLEVSRRCWSAVPLRGKVLLIGGFTDTYHRDVLTYDLGSQSLSRAGDLPQGVCDAKFFRLGSFIIGSGGQAADRTRSGCTFESKLHGDKQAADPFNGRDLLQLAL